MAKSAPIFIVGPPRSGTHLVRFCLSQHSRIFISPETSFFIRAYGNRRLDRALFRDGLTDRLVDELIDQSGDPTMADYAAHRDSLKRQAQGAADYAAFADAFFGAMTRMGGKARWGEKTPLHVLYLPQILSVFPDARILIVMREAKNTLASTIKSGHVRAGFHNALATYLRCQREQRLFGDHPNVMSLGYEDFVSTPEQTLRQICTFLGEEYEAAMVQPGMLDSSYADDVMSVQSDIAIAPNDPDKWRRGLSEAQGAFVDRCVSGQPMIPFTSANGRRLVVERIRLATRIAKNRAGFFYLGRVLHRDRKTGGTAK